MRWLRFRLEAPMASFGRETIDARGRTGDFPTQSMLTGLFANALGWSRSMREEHQRLQDRLVYGTVRAHEPVLGRMTDYQTAQLRKSDRAWTTRGSPSGRDGGSGTYEGAHQLHRDYHADARILGVARLDPEDRSPTLQDLADALERPARPLFIGRKSCLPSARVFDGWVEDAPNARTALRMIVPGGTALRALWPASEGVAGAARIATVSDERNWITGYHAGTRRVCEGELSATDSTS